MKKTIIILFAFLVLSACSSVTIRTDNQKESTNRPTYQKSFNYWWWGLRGEYDVNVREVCSGNNVTQMQSISRLSDTAFTIITLGIYSPRSARVWCEGGQDA